MQIGSVEIPVSQNIISSNSLKLDRETAKCILIAFALNGLLADHLDHSDKKIGQETCAETVARLACEFADAALHRIERDYSHQ